MGIRRPVQLLPDPAVAVDADVRAAEAILAQIGGSSFAGALKIGVSVRDLSWRFDAAGVQRYLDVLGRLCDRLIEQFTARIIFIPQCSYEHGTAVEDDRAIARRILAAMRNKGRAHLLDRQYRAEAVMGLYHCIDLALPTRLHGAVFSAAARTPFAAIAYLPKVRGFLREVGMEEWTIAIEMLGDEGSLFEKIANLMARRHEVSEFLKLNMEHVESRAQEHFDVIARLMRCPEAA
jgi:polysaccharide pyruvyl transferase WcaK-like protein